MAKVRNISGDDLSTVYGDVAAGATVDVPDGDILPPGFNEDTDGATYRADNPRAANWRVPGVWEVTTDAPAVKPKPDADPAV